LEQEEETSSKVILGLGWQGIVPAKTKKMSEAMVNATLTQLIQMEDIVQRLDPTTVADLLLPIAPQIVEPMVDDLFFHGSHDDSSSSTSSNVDHTSHKKNLPGPVREWILKQAKSSGPWQGKFSKSFLIAVTQGFQQHVNQLLNLNNCVVQQMLADRYVPKCMHSCMHVCMDITHSRIYEHMMNVTFSLSTSLLLYHLLWIG
jgi:hypothetical protein